MEEDILRELGFTEREVKVYLSLLSLGSTTVGPIAANTRMQHSKVYQTLERLIDRGLVSYVMKSKVKHFFAQEPKQILNLLKEKERKFVEILPMLNQRNAFSEERQIATIYEGQKAIKSMFENILDSLSRGGNYYIFGICLAD